jgi:hypothetical protein
VILVVTSSEETTSLEAKCRYGAFSGSGFTANHPYNYYTLGHMFPHELHRSSQNDIPAAKLSSEDTAQPPFRYYPLAKQANKTCLLNKDQSQRIVGCLFNDGFIIGTTALSIKFQDW